MASMRAFLRQHAATALVIVMIALLARVMVPAGFMPATAKDGTITVRVCSGQMLEPKTMEIAIPGLPPKSENQQQKSELPCAFAGLATAMLGGADPALLMVALAFALALALRQIIAPRLSQPAYIRPPLRGPPTQL